MLIVPDVDTGLPDTLNAGGTVSPTEKTVPGV